MVHALVDKEGGGDECHERHLEDLVYIPAECEQMPSKEQHQPCFQIQSHAGLKASCVGGAAWQAEGVNDVHYLL